MHLSQRDFATGSMLNNHEKSQVHSEACLKFSTFTQPNIIERMNVQLLEDQEWHRKSFMILWTSLRYLLRQGLAIRGHEELQGNLLQLLKVQSEDNKKLATFIEDKNYQSPDVTNELIILMGNHLLQHLLHRIRECQFYSIIADETRDTSNKEQLSISLRWVDSDYNIFENLVGMIQVTRTDAETLTLAIKDVLIRCMTPLSSCRARHMMVHQIWQGGKVVLQHA